MFNLMWASTPLHEWKRYMCLYIAFAPLKNDYQQSLRQYLILFEYLLELFQMPRSTIVAVIVNSSAVRKPMIPLLHCLLLKHVCTLTSMEIGTFIEKWRPCWEHHQYFWKTLSCCMAIKASRAQRLSTNVRRETRYLPMLKGWSLL